MTLWSESIFDIFKPGLPACHPEEFHKIPPHPFSSQPKPKTLFIMRFHRLAFASTALLAVSAFQGFNSKSTVDSLSCLLTVVSALVIIRFSECLGLSMNRFDAACHCDPRLHRLNPHPDIVLPSVLSIDCKLLTNLTSLTSRIALH